MTPRPTRTLILTACALLAFAGPSFAQTISDKGKRKLPKLFAEAVSAVSESTVRVQTDGKDAALGTIVTADGFILTKGSEVVTPTTERPRGAITCNLRDGTVYDAKLIGYHKLSDLAMLKIEAEGLKPVKFAPVAVAEVGNWVAVTGPSSEPIAVGVLSAGHRKLYREESFIENANKGYLGVLGLTDTDDGIGVRIGSVDPKGSAAKSGMKNGDVVFEVGGKVVKTRDDLLATMDGYKPGDSLTVKVKRGDEDVNLKVKLGAKGDFDRGAFQNGMGGALSGRRTGFPSVIQHDTVVKPIDCGGPLVDLDGQVLGLNIARAGRVETWALPGDVIQPIMADLKAGKYSPINKE
jgi:serine protease Do